MAAKQHHHAAIELQIADKLDKSVASFEPDVDNVMRINLEFDQHPDPTRHIYTRSAYPLQPRPNAPIISSHSRFDSPLPFCSTASPASIRVTTASIAAENVTAPSR